jgi:hypothetical protein
MSAREVDLDRDQDAVWIIALWKAIHGGDSSPETVAAKAIAVLAPFLPGAEYSFSPSSADDSSAVDDCDEDSDNDLHARATGRCFNEPEPGMHRYYYRFKDHIFALDCQPLPTC